MAIVKRLVKGSPLTAAEHDTNIDEVLARANHTGSQAISTVTGLQTALDAKSDSSHTHDADEIDDTSTTNKFTTAAEISKLAGVEDNATADQTGAEIEGLLDTELANVRWKEVEVPAGGTANQVLKKIDGTDYNYSWQDDSGGAGSGDSWSDAVDADIVAGVASTYDVGSATFPMAEGHFDTIYVGGTAMSGATVADPGNDAMMTWDDSETAGSELGWGSYGQGLEQSGRSPQATDNLMTDSIQFVIDGGGSAITTGTKGYIEVPYGCTIEQVTMLADQSGSIVVDIWKDTYANYPPIDADSITASAVPTISASTKSQDATLTGWTTSVAAGDVLGFNVDSASTVTRVTVALRVKKT